MWHRYTYVSGYSIGDVDGLLGGRSSSSQRESSIRPTGSSRSPGRSRLNCPPSEFSEILILIYLPTISATSPIFIFYFFLPLKLDADEAIPAAEIAADIAAQSEIFSGDNVAAVDVSLAQLLLFFFFFTFSFIVVRCTWESIRSFFFSSQS